MNMNEELTQYYESVDIVPVDKMRTYDEMFSAFKCKQKDDCWAVCKKKWCKDPHGDKFLFSPPIKGEGDIHVSQCYQDGKYQGICIPRIVVLSLSAPMPDFSSVEITERKPLNPHWRGTTTTVRSLLHPFIELDLAGNAGDQSTNIIEQLFVHLRTAKCCSNAGGSSSEPDQVYENCGRYLSKEVSVFKPDVIVTQGNKAHYQSEKHIFDKNAKKTAVRPVQGIPNSIARIVSLKGDNRRVYWLRSYFPYGSFYSSHAGPPIPSEYHLVGAHREYLVRYGKDIQQFMNKEDRWTNC